MDRTRALVMGLGALVIAIGFGSVFWEGAQSEPSTRPAMGVAALATAAPVATSVEPPEAIATEPTARPAVSASDASDATARITVRFDPPDARVVVDGDPLALDADGTAIIDRPPAGGMHVVLVKAAGHLDRLFIVDPSSAATLEISLSPTDPKSLSSG